MINLTGSVALSPSLSRSLPPVPISLFLTLSLSLSLCLLLYSVCVCVCVCGFFFSLSPKRGLLADGRMALGDLCIVSGFLRAG